jgi:quercetin dioxygenase-like cupin family protein
MQKTILEIPEKELAKGIRGRYFHTNSTTIGFVDIDKGAILPAHSHMHEQTTQITEGQLEMTIGGITQILEPGVITLIPSHVVHSARALTNCKVVDIFSPVREDYK